MDKNIVTKKLLELLWLETRRDGSEDYNICVQSYKSFPSYAMH